MQAKVTFGAFGRETPAYDSQADILLGANLGAAEWLGWIERNTSWEKRGSSRAETVAGRSFCIESDDPRLAPLAGRTFATVAEARDAVRAAVAGE